jgi:hypothetical protein
MQAGLQSSFSSEDLRPSDQCVLLALQRYYFLTSSQLCRLLYSPGSLTYIQSKLRKLVTSRYLQRIWMPKASPFGSSPAVYTLARRGLNHIRRLGLEVPRRHRSSEHESASYLFLSHTLELNDLLIAADELDRLSPTHRVASMLHERWLKRRPVHVINNDGKRVAVVPDAWLDLRIASRFQVCLVIELDRGTEEQRAWRRKIANLLSFADGPYQDAFGTTSLTVVVATTAGERRLLDLLRWTEAELTAAKEATLGDLFLFGSFTAESAAARDIFLAPRWFQPFRRKPVALLDGG